MTSFVTENKTLPASKLLLRAELLLQLLAALRLGGRDQVLVIVVRDERPRCVRRYGSLAVTPSGRGGLDCAAEICLNCSLSSPREAIKAAGNETIPERVALRLVAASCVHASSEQVVPTAGCCLWCLT